MATPSHITMLREISAAGDRERTGALDVEWEGAHATLFFIFGHPSHVVFETTDGRNLAGEAALDAFVDELPTEFRVAPWRRAMVTDDTLHCSAEDLMGLFQRRHAVETNGHAAEPTAPATAPPTDAQAPTEVSPAVPSAPTMATDQPPSELNDFPLLPLGPALWTDAAANVVNLEAALPRLPDSLLVLAGPTCQGTALIAGGRITDALWMNPTGALFGDEAAQALMSSLEGTLTAYRLDDVRLATALPMLWRSPRLGAGLPAGWLHTDDIVAEVRTSGRSCGLLVDSQDPGVALFASGELVAVYTVSQRWPATSMAALRDLLHEPDARVSVIGEVAATAAPAVAADPAPLTPAANAAPATAEPEAAAPDAAEPETAETATAEPATAEPESAQPETAQPESAAPEAAAPEAAEPEAASAATTEEHPVALDEVAAEPTAVTAADEPTAALDTQAAETGAESVDVPAARSKGKGRGRGKARADDVEAAATPPADAAITESDEPAPAEPTDGSSSLAARLALDDLQFEPAMFTIADLSSDSAPETTGMAEVEAREATEFVPARLDIDVDALRAELTDIATVWLGADDAAPVAQAIGAARPGVDDFVSTIAAIGAMEIPGHETAVVRAMAREMHFRASEVLCGV